MVSNVHFHYSSGNLTDLDTEMGPLPAPHLFQEELTIITEGQNLRKILSDTQGPSLSLTTGSFVLISHGVAQSWQTFGKKALRRRDRKITLSLEIITYLRQQSSLFALVCVCACACVCV